MIAPNSSTSEMSFYSNALEGPNAKDPEKVAGMFEAMFYKILLSANREASQGDPLFDSPTMKQIQGMHDDELAVHLGAQGNLGIADMMLEAIQKQQANTYQPNSNSGLLKDPAPRR